MPVRPSDGCQFRENHGESVRVDMFGSLLYYGFKGCSLYARRGEPGDEATRA